MAKRGRRGKLTPERQAKLCDLISQGVHQSVAAARAGISASTFYEWTSKGRAAKSGQWKEFHDAIQEAQAVAEVTMVLQLNKHGRTDWRAIAWRLERRFPDRWKPRTEVEQTVTAVVAGAPLPLLKELSQMTTDQLEALAGIDLEGMGLPTDGYPGGEPEIDADTDED